jgi:hypothetical protein
MIETRLFDIILFINFHFLFSLTHVHKHSKVWITFETGRYLQISTHLKPTNSISKEISGLPTQQDNQYASFVDIHMETAKGIPTDIGDVSMGTARTPWNDDIHMETARAGTTMKQGGLQMSERELLESSEIKRKATVAQLCKCPTPRFERLPVERL